MKILHWFAAVDAAPHTRNISIQRVLLMVNQAAISHTTNEVTYRYNETTYAYTPTPSYIHTAMRVHNAQGELLMLL